MIADRFGFLSDERTEASHVVERPDDTVPLYRVVNTCRAGRYAIEKTIYTHPKRDVLIQECVITLPPAGSDGLSAYVSVDPRLSGDAAQDDAWLADYEGRPMMVARGGGICLALACSVPWSARTVGFAGVSDGRRDLAEHHRLRGLYERAHGGTVALTGAIDVDVGHGRFVLALGFGATPDEAARAVLAGLRRTWRRCAAHLGAWRAWQTTLDVPPRENETGPDPARVGAAVLRTHMARSPAGAAVASLSTPWGEAQTPGTSFFAGGYHLVWPRDQVEVAGGLLAVGATREARDVLDDLRQSQSADGHWPQNMWCDGTKYWAGVQLGETALPILLADRMRRQEVLRSEEVRSFWPTLRRAIAYIVGRGPSTQEDRWENQPGYTPFTLATVIAALIVAADIAHDEGEEDVATYLRETADAWNASIDDWLYVEGTDLAHRTSVAGYYIRIAPHGWAEAASTATGRLETAGAPRASCGLPVTEVVSPDVLSLVRFGIRAANDPRIVDTVKVVDAVLKVDTPRGPSWRRYSGDGYGEHSDGTPFIKRDGDTRGRAWPLLTGERAHYELAAGRRDQALRLLHAMEALAGDSGMMPEQVWDTEDRPDRRLYQGRPTGSAMPLAWAHAEYLTLRRSLAAGRPVDCPPKVVRHFAGRRPESRFVIWRPTTGADWSRGARTCASSSRRLGAFAGQLKAFRRWAVGSPRATRRSASTSPIYQSTTSPAGPSFSSRSMGRPAIGTRSRSPGVAVRLKARPLNRVTT